MFIKHGSRVLRNDFVSRLDELAALLDLAVHGRGGHAVRGPLPGLTGGELSHIVLYVVDSYRLFFVDHLEVFAPFLFVCVAPSVDGVDCVLYGGFQCVTGVELVSYIQFLESLGQSVGVDAAAVRAPDGVSAAVGLAP